MNGDALIRGGRLIDPSVGLDAALDIRILNGRVAEVGVDLAPGDSDREIDAAGLVVAPGFVDLHTHLRVPGEEHKETMATGTAAASRGGFTTVCAMPNTVPAIDAAPMVASVLDAARGSAARVLPIGAVTLGRQGRELAELAALRDAGAVAVSDDGDAIADAGVARRAFEYLADLDIPLAEHCEDPRLSGGGVMHDGVISARMGLRGQPSLAELSIVERDIALADAAGAALHCCHLSTAAALDAVDRARSRGVRVTAEVTPHHLWLDHAAVAGCGEQLAYDTAAKVNPPLRTRADVDACIDALAAGVVDAVATDHAPHAAPDKHCEFDVAAFGISGLESAWSIVASLVAARRLTLMQALERLTIGPVGAWALDRRTMPSGESLRGLGTLQVGAPGDVVLLAPNVETIIDPQLWASRGKNTPLAGQRLTGIVAATMLRGELVWDGRPQDASQDPLHDAAQGGCS